MNVEGLTKRGGTFFSQLIIKQGKNTQIITPKQAQNLFILWVLGEGGVGEISDTFRKRSWRDVGMDPPVSVRLPPPGTEVKHNLAWRICF